MRRNPKRALAARTVARCAVAVALVCGSGLAAVPAQAGDGGGNSACRSHKIVRSGAHADYVECHTSGRSKVYASVHDDKADRYCAVLTIKMRRYDHKTRACGAGARAGYTTAIHKGDAKVLLGYARR